MTHRVLNAFFLGSASLLSFVLVTVVASGPDVVELTNEHTDLRLIYEPESTNVLSVVIRDSDRGIVYPPDQVILVVAEEARLALPSGTPFGNQGDPLWVLPQSQDPALLYLGTSADGIPSGTFTGPLEFALKELRGPGRFYLWQAGEAGDLAIRMNTADGISDADVTTPIAGSHEHFNWGFTAPGIYRLTFQASGQPTGEVTNVYGLETVVTFHVHPLPDLTPFEQWQQSHWSPGEPEAIQGPNADPEGDGIVNAMEYALGLNPIALDTGGLPAFTTVTVNGQVYGAVQFTRVKAATDLDYQVVAADSPVGLWQPLFAVSSIEDRGDTEIVLALDDRPQAHGTARFYRLLIRFRVD
jgi:surface-anchored protein